MPAICSSSRCLLPVEGRRAVVRHQLAGEALVDRLRELARLAQVGRRGLEPDQVGVRRVGERRARSPTRARPRMRKKPSGVRSPVQNGAVALVDVARQQRGRQRIGARDEERRHVEHVGREPRRGERADELAGRDEHLAAEVAALLLGRELVLEVHARGAGLDHRLHQLEGVQRRRRSRPPRRRRSAPASAGRGRPRPSRSGRRAAARC